MTDQPGGVSLPPQPLDVWYLKRELSAYLDQCVITSENIGDIRWSLFVPWDSAWNGIVRDETASRENRSPDGDGQSLEGRRGDCAASAEVEREGTRTPRVGTNRPNEQSDQQPVGVQGHGGKPQTVNAGGRVTEQYEPQLRRPRSQTAGSEPADSLPLPPRGWQDIASAPKDGTPFLVYFGDQVELVAGWREYSEIIGFGETPSTHWHAVPLPPNADELEAALPPVGESDPATEPALRLCARCAHAAYVGLRCLNCGRQALAAPVGEGTTRSHEED